MAEPERILRRFGNPVTMTQKVGRPEACVLFAQTFVHPELDEYVDEVLFGEPVVVTACEFIEQNASSTCAAVKLNGATSPPSFALEVFVQCEGETRFRRICQPFLYSHSSSSILEVEAIVTNHLVVRGSYRSLSLVIYGNTAEDLGQFNIEVGLDSSLTNTVSTIDGDLEDLPLALRSTSLTIEEFEQPLETLALVNVTPDLAVEVKQFLQVLIKILDLPELKDAQGSVLNCVLSVASIYANPNTTSQKDLDVDKLNNVDVLIEASRELLCLHEKQIQHQQGEPPTDILADSTSLESGIDFMSTKKLVDTLIPYFEFGNTSGNDSHLQASKTQNLVLLLGIAILLCHTKESCFHFVNGGGMELLEYALTSDSAALKLMALADIEQATRHSVGCEGFLGWWPREKDNIPSSVSERYCKMLKLVLQNQRHDIVSLATYILHRVRVYEVASRYENAILSILGNLSAARQGSSTTLDMLADAKLQLMKLSKLINLRGPIDNPSPVASVTESLVLDDAGFLSYKATRGLINKCDLGYWNQDVDSHLLSLLKERGFLPLSAALLSSSLLRSESGPALDLFVDIVSHIEAIILSLLFSRSGLVFLLHEPELASTVIRALMGSEISRKVEYPSLRYASVLISKGFFFNPQDVAKIVEMHLKMIYAIDRLTSSPNNEEFLWLLWDLCRLSRSNCGRQALLSLIHFPEALSVLMAALHSTTELDPISTTNGDPTLNLAIFHAAAEIFEVIVTDSTTSSLGSWIDHAKELHRALHSSSPGSNKKDAPARLLEWIDAGVVYHRNGALGLLRYAAVLASGGDAHMASTSMLASDTVDVDNVVGDSSNSSDGNIIDNLLGKRITEKDFPGVILRDSSIVQLTTAFRILAFISDTSNVAAALYDEGAIMVIHAVLINSRLMLERSSNIYDYLVDEGNEGNSTSDLLLERNREQSFVDLLIPSLILLINLLQKLQETKEQHRNTKLMTALLQLHREVSPKLAASVADVTSSYPNFALGLEAVCHLIASALACWPVYGWTPGLFHHLVDSLHATSILALGPKEICSLLCILIDLLPDEGVWLWKHGNPMLSVLRTLAVGTILGPLKERHIRWYLHSACQDKLLSQLTSQLPKIAQIILHCATSTLVVIQDMLRILIVRITRVSVKNASVLVQPIIHNILARLSEDSTLSDIEAYKVYRLLDFLSLLLEHPHAKPLILNESGIKMLTVVLDRCLGAFDSADVSKNQVSMFSWCIPVFKLISLISDGRTFSKHSTLNERCNSENISAEAFVVLLGQILRLCKVLPAGKELMECLSTFRQLGSSSEARMALLSIMAEHERLMANEVNQNVAASEWKDEPPLLGCWTKLLRIVTSKDVFPVYALEAIRILSAGSLCFCLEGESLNLERVAAIKYLFGIKDNTSPSNKFEENMNSIQELKDLLEMSIADSFEGDALMSETVSFARQLLLLLQSPSGVVTAEHLTTNSLVLTTAATASSKFYRITDASARRIQDYDSGDVIDKFLWECPEILRDGLPIKRKMVSLEGPNRRARGDNASTEITTQSSFSRGSVPPVPSGPTRRDTFRQRKPNTSRPPSMHVDDYVARERNADSSNNPNVIAIPRIGSSGRPPSIHVDEFMARQRERHNPVGLSVTDSASQMKSAPPEIKTDTEKTGRSQQLKPDLSDDLQGIDIVFDAEEAETDDKLPFPQPDDILPQSTPAVVEQNSPHSIVEETESDVNESSQFSHLNNPITSNTDENTPSEFSSRMSASRPELPLTREPSITSEKRFPEFMEDSKSFAPKTAKNVELAASGSNNGGNYVKSSGSAATPNFYPKTSLHRSGTPPLPSGSQGLYDHKYMPNQPPLPPMPPPATILPVMSQHADTITSQSSPYNLANDVQPSVQPRFHVQQEYLSTSSTLMVSSPQPDSQHARPSHPSPGRPTRHHPPLPPTPPPYSASLHASSVKYATSHSQSYQSIGTVEHQQNATMHAAGLSGIPMGSYQPSPLMPQLLFNRPNSAPNNMFASSSALHNVENVSSMSQNLGINLSTIQPSLGQLQPLQPPQLPRPPPHHLRPLVPASLQSEQGVPLQQSTQSTQMQPPQMLQQSQGSQGHMYYQSQQQGNLMHLSQQQVEHFQQQVLPPQGDSSSQQNDPGMSLHDFFKSPEAIQTLLSDRDKLCQLLEQHPKLMQMLQERLGQI